MEILSEKIANNSNEVKKIMQFLECSWLLENGYQYNEADGRCSFKINRSINEKAIKILFIHINYKRTDCLVEVFPVLKVEEVKADIDGDDFYMELKMESNILKVEAPPEKTFCLTITSETRIHVCDIDKR
ncbi:MAG: hypothetical protein V1893_01600 [Candidatus Omnitrophota bacterium]